jgi:hypothetical protein
VCLLTCRSAAVLTLRLHPWSPVPMYVPHLNVIIFTMEVRRLE